MENKIYPFIMISGNDDKMTVLKKFQNLKNMGIHSAVLQYSPPVRETGHNHFNHTYFEILDHMVDACKNLDMTFWIQDAAPFPTGSANGSFYLEEYMDRGKIYLEERHTNLRGPKKNGVILYEYFNGLARGNVEEIMADLHPTGEEAAQKGKLIGAVLIRRNQTLDGTLCFDMDTAINVTDCICETYGTISIDIPDGEWRLFFFYETHRGGRKNYMNLLDENSVKVQIERVLDPHYEYLKHELGKTWEGFFYDEPELGNTSGYNFHSMPGISSDQTPGPLPWSHHMPGVMKKHLGKGWLLMLAALWYSCGPKTRFVRYHYMDAVTRLVCDCYNGQILPWCRHRNISYIGHVLEDENSHARLGCGTGHFFRTQKYQDMAGIDLIAGQILPGLDMPGISGYFAADGDGEFYHYGLAKLAASAACINPLQKQKCFCEVNALYGDMSNGKFYKFLLDHLIIRGINHLIPVITDALPTEHGKILFNYAQKMCRLLEDTRPVISVAVLYHAESEWSGMFTYFQRPGKVLAKHQIDYHVIPQDALTEDNFYKTRLLQGCLEINGHPYKALVVPGCDFIRKDTFHILLTAMDRHIPVYFTDRVPFGFCECPGEICWGRHTPIVVDLEMLADRLYNDGIWDIYSETEQPFLRYMHFKKKGLDYYMFLNEEPWKDICTELTILCKGDLKVYDVMNEQQQPVSFQIKNHGLTFSLNLRQYESRLYIVDTDNNNLKSSNKNFQMSSFTLPLNWSVTIYPQMPSQQSWFTTKLQDLSTIKGFQRYTDPIHYETVFEIQEENTCPDFIDLGNVCDSAQIILNGHFLGCCIAAPYVFNIHDTVRIGKNILEISVFPSIARKKVDKLLMPLGALPYPTMPGIGLLGPVSFF